MNKFINGDRGLFFCSLCTETKSGITDRVKCPECARLICKECFESLSLVGLVNCPYCSSSLNLEEISTESSEVIDIIKEGTKKIETGDLFTAEVYFQQALRIDSNSIAAWKKLEQLYFQMKNWEKTKYCFSKVLQMNPEDQEVKKNYIEADHRIRSYY
ncbi:MAG: tetratricopeptide repeat protein [Promethearchaeota archaeon]